MTAIGYTRSALLTFVFATVCVISAIALVFTKHEARQQFIELEALSAERDDLDIEYRQQQTEESTWASPTHIEGIAVERLELRRPELDEITAIEPE